MAKMSWRTFSRSYQKSSMHATHTKRFMSFTLPKRKVFFFLHLHRFWKKIYYVLCIVYGTGVDALPIRGHTYIVAVGRLSQLMADFYFDSFLILVIGRMYVHNCALLMSKYTLIKMIFFIFTEKWVGKNETLFPQNAYLAAIKSNI